MEGMSDHHLNQIELSRRWGFSPRTLEGWRWFGKGPAFIKAGGKVLYRLEDIEAFEATQLRGSNPASPQVHGEHSWRQGCWACVALH
jgi:hypothetical protein